MKKIIPLLLVFLLISCKSTQLNSKKESALLNISKEKDSGSFVNLRNYSNDFVFDMKYATTDNFLKEKVYPCDECFLRVKTVRALLEANKAFLEKGFRIKIYDCYRPRSIQDRKSTRLNSSHQITSY